MTTRATHWSGLAALGVLVALGGCELPPGGDATPPAPPGADARLDDRLDVVIEVEPVAPEEATGYVLAPEEITMFVGEELSLDLRLAEPDLFALRAGTLPPAATFTVIPTGGFLSWAPLVSDIGTHEIVLLVVDYADPNLVIAQEMIVIDVLSRYRFIEYGF